MSFTKNPAKRSGFASQWQPKEKVAAVLRPIRQLIPQEAKLPHQSPKFDYVRSTRLMNAYGVLYCQHCGADDGTIVGAHSNYAIHGKGRAIKATDSRCASLCYTCHINIDQGSNLVESEKQSIWWNAHVKTVQKLVILKLWPLDIPVPSLDWPESWA